MHENDNPPIGIIICAGKSETLVKYATAGLSEKVFVSQYLTNLPTEKELQRIMEEEQLKLHQGQSYALSNLYCSNLIPGSAS